MSDFSVVTELPGEPEALDEHPIEATACLLLMNRAKKPALIAL